MDVTEEKRDRVIKAALACRIRLIAYARSLLGNSTAADDAVQEAMLVVIKKFEQFEEGTSILAWCRSIVRIEVLRTKQRDQRQLTLAQRLLDDAVDATFDEFQIDRREEDAESRREVLRCCLEKVPGHGQSVLKARFADDLSYQQIGERLGMSIEAVRKALFRIKKQIRACVESSSKAMQ